MIKLPTNVWLLTISQALLMSSSSLIVFTGGIIGSNLTPNPQLATLPIACGIVGTAVATVPVALLMRRFGRKNVFLVMCSYSILVAFYAAFCLSIASFYLFCSSMVLMGFSIACIVQFRFAAMESVAANQIPLAASTVLLGGIASAFIGPEIGTFGQHLLPYSFAGSFLLLAVLFLVGMVILSRYQNFDIAQQEVAKSGRPLREILNQPVFWVAATSGIIGYAVMSFIMTATPVSMHVMDGHSLNETKWVIQSHIMAMFLPSLITAYIIRRIGTINMIFLGLVSFAVCIAIAYTGQSIGHYWTSLVLLGIGWNFLFLGGTTLLPQSYHSSERFKVQALNDFMIFGIQAIAALSAGWVIHALGWDVMLLFTIPLLGVPILAIRFLK